MFFKLFIQKKMNENFLHYLWKYKKFSIINLKTTRDEELILLQTGIHNTSQSGPDFFNAVLIINDQKWAGNVEIHKKSSDWYVHHHQKDKAYDNVILHVVWEDDVGVYRNDNTVIPTLQLSDFVSPALLASYTAMFARNKDTWISCEKEMPEVSKFVISNWQERLYVERLEQKSIIVASLLKSSANDWEAVLFILIAKNFGLKSNGESFLNIANSIDFSVIRKSQHCLETLEALLFGQAGLLNEEGNDPYYNKLRHEYDFLKTKFNLNTDALIPVQFFRLRPANFPTIRLAQLAKLYYTHKQLFSQVIKCKTSIDYYKLFKIDTSDFWREHYTFSKKSPFRKKGITKAFVDLVLINTIIPIKFLYTQSMSNTAEEEIYDLITSIKYEENSVVRGFIDLGIDVDHALHSQAMIHLKNKYCDKRACLQCAVGNYLLNTE